MGDNDFERAFASLAHAELEQKAPGLFAYLIGFQLMNKNDDETRAVGIFGFKVGDQWYYAPVFWLNGKIRGYDLLYIVTHDLFVPLQEKWITYITNKKPYVLGEAVKNKGKDPTYGSPDFSIFSESPLSKSGAYLTEHEKEVVMRGDKVYPYVIPLDNVPESLFEQPFGEKYASIKNRLSLTNALKGNTELTASLLTTMAGNTKFASAVYAFYSPTEILELSSSARKETIQKKAARKVLEKMSAILADSSNKAKVIIDAAEKSLTESEKEIALANDVIVRDTRTSKSEVYAKPDFSKVLSSPTISGVWSVMRDDCKFVDCYCVTSPTVFDRDDRGKMLVLDLSGKSYTMHSTCDVISKGIKPGSINDLYEKAKLVSSIEKNDFGIFVNSDGQCSELVRIDDKSTINGNYRFDMSTVSCNWLCEGKRVAQTSAVRTFSMVYNTLIIGNDARFLRLGAVKDEEALKKFKLSLGGKEELDLFVRKHDMINLLVKRGADDTIFVRYKKSLVKDASFKQTMKYLIETVGLSENSARAVVKEASVAPFEGIVKEAVSSFDERYGVPVVNPESDKEVIPTTELGDRDDVAPVDQQAQQDAISAVSNGQKDVFDLSVLSGLIRLHDVSDAMQDLIKDVIKGNDRVGRLLFMLYWHFDKFLEKYGEEDMQELEDTLRNVFKTTGDLVLFLKQRGVDNRSANQATIDIGDAPQAVF